MPTSNTFETNVKNVVKISDPADVSDELNDLVVKFGDLNSKN